MSNIQQSQSLTSDPDHWLTWQMSKLPLAMNGGPSGLVQQTVTSGDVTDAPFALSSNRHSYEAGVSAGHKVGFEIGRPEGYQKGLEEGRAVGKKELADKTNGILAPLASMVSNFEEALSLLDSDIGAELVELALAIGNQLARDRLDEQPELVLDVVRELLHMEPSLHTRPRLVLHPLDLDLVAQHLGSEFDTAGWKLLPDPQMTRGGCRLTSSNEEYDATWETRCKAIISQVRHRRSTGNPETDNGQQAQ